MNTSNRAFIEKVSLKPPYDDDDIYIKINSLLTSLSKKYNLTNSDINTLYKMLKEGASFEQVEQMAMSLNRQHQVQYETACQRIAEKAGGTGEYHGFLGSNNPKKQQGYNYEIGR